LFGAVILLVPVARALWREEAAGVAVVAGGGGPIVFIGLGLMAYNALRFDNPAGIWGRTSNCRPNTSQHFSLRYLWFNFRVGFLEPRAGAGVFRS